ncbi:glucans biosynthesis glucosyltransferase MdoH [Vineibacter terrae]|uniref:Glucans biosynthesis glucosyltransferase H n=1 Tax=Vineibacter terrae TaxID=2586908 RepID=A0A5C8P8K9_9HYPH|nr:glucans biosynthesis glucosyltransferase MdoH [Vineibacter terrae]TXL70072.1 glucans biosynthesis glucosyltransferase MdoH [Vineibacter terrae]
MTGPAPSIPPHRDRIDMPQKMAWRRIVFALLVTASVAAMLGLMAYTLGDGGLDIVDWLMLACFAVTLPWSAIGFWNAAIGFALMRFARDPAALAAPAVRLGRSNAAISGRTAILVCTRNEDVARLQLNLTEMTAGLIATGAAPHLHLFLLSDTDQPGIAAAEEGMAARLAARFGAALPITYRRRQANPGFKAGNIRDFCQRWGGDFDFALVLDADSFMSPAAMLRLIRVIAADPRLGIVQSLVVGRPSLSPFARIFQFGMRLGMRSYTLGSAFWQGDCGPYWGHNAIIRLAPFIAHCALPVLPGGGPLAGDILSHDQVEAALMRRAGYEVRVLPEEAGSWEENPPTLLEFIRRDLRWCQGNMQYWKLLAMLGLQPVSRFQLALAILMFIGSPAWMLLVALATFRGLLIETQGPVFRPDTGVLLFLVAMGMTFAPKIASIFDILLRPGAADGFGGALRFIASAVLETVFFAVLAPIMAVAHTVFIGGLVVGRAIGWTAPVREDHRVTLAAAAQRLWVQTLCGIGLLAWFVAMAPGALGYGIPFFAPLLLAIPFAMLSARRDLGAALQRLGLAAIPEEMAPPSELVRLGPPGLVGDARATADAADGD